MSNNTRECFCGRCADCLALRVGELSEKLETMTADRDQARKTSAFNKDNHLAAEAEIERLKKSIGLIDRARQDVILQVSDLTEVIRETTAAHPMTCWCDLCKALDRAAVAEAKGIEKRNALCGAWVPTMGPCIAEVPCKAHEPRNWADTHRPGEA